MSMPARRIRRIHQLWGDGFTELKLWADGVHDDAKELQRFVDAEAASSNQVIHFPPGLYFLASTLRFAVRSGATIIGWGVTFRTAIPDNGSTFYIAGCDGESARGITMCGFRFEGAYSAVQFGPETLTKVTQ